MGAAEIAPITAWLTLEQRNRIIQLAAADRIPISEVIRAALVAYGIPGPIKIPRGYQAHAARSS